jgi:deoxyribonuclease V
VQICLSKKIILENCLPKKINLVAGVDVAYSDYAAVSAVAVLNYETLELIETKTAICKTKIPYISTLFAFRELPPAMASIKKLYTKPDVFLSDSHGIAHPRKCGFASHLGLAIKKPTIGVAKNKLFGTLEPANGKVNVVHNKEILGEEVVTKEGCRPVYVSVGNMISLEDAIEIVKHLTRNCRTPEPLRIAHNIATQQRNERLAKKTRQIV